MNVRHLNIPDNAIPISDRSEAPEGAQIVTGKRGGLYYIPVGEQGTQDDVTTGEQQAAEVAAQAEPTELAGGVAAAISDSRDDFHDIRNALVDAENNQAAQEILADELSQAEIDALAEEVAIQEEMREEFGVLESLNEIQFGQEVLVDGDRPFRGVVDDVSRDTVWVRKANRDIASGISLDDFTVFAEPIEGEPDVQTAEPGRYGMASNEEVLSDPFEYATEVTGSREAGITDGNTTGDSMKVLDMADGSRVFAIPVDAYETATTGVVDGPREAEYNNENSPKVIEALGGSGCKTQIVDGPGNTTYIAKEGVEGELLGDYMRNRRGEDKPDKLIQSAKQTRAAAYFVGNMDLHNANVMVSDDDELVIIDHDSAGTYYDIRDGTEKVADISRFSPRLTTDNSEEIYDNASDILDGDVDLSGVGRAHTDYAQQAAEKAMRVAVMDPSFDVPSDEVPEEMKMLDGFEDDRNWPEAGELVSVVDDNGDIITGEVEQKTMDYLIIPELSMTEILSGEEINRVVEVL